MAPPPPLMHGIFENFNHACYVSYPILSCPPMRENFCEKHGSLAGMQLILAGLPKNKGCFYPLATKLNATENQPCFYFCQVYKFILDA